jgi:transcriptional regulator with XRE-family HTH domain
VKHETLAIELLRALRGKRSQLGFSRRLGYGGNVAYLWESGRRHPPASVLFRAASINRIELDSLEAFVRPAVLELPTARSWSSRDSGQLLRALAGETPPGVIARALRVDRGTVARWLKGSTEPSIVDLLRLVEKLTRRLVEFVGSFIDPLNLRSMRALAVSLAAQKHMAYEEPWSHAVLRALELEAYRSERVHIEGFVAKSIGVSLRAEQDLLQKLHAARLIRLRKGKWVASQVLAIDTRADKGRNQRLKEHWAAVGLERLQRGATRGDGLYSYNLFSTSARTLAKIRELHLEYFERVRRLIAESSSAERVVLLNQQLIPLDE